MKKISYISLFFYSCTILSFELPRNSKIYVAGKGLVGSAICKILKENGFDNIINPSHKELDLTNQEAVNTFFEKEKPEYVFLSAAKVGGIKANMDYPAQFIYENLMIESNTIQAAQKHKVKKFLFLGSSCIYPRDCAQPIKEEYLLTSPLEKSNESYALAKIAGIYLCKAYNKQYKTTKFISCMPCNLYGPGDNFNLQTSHVLPALMAKMEHARINKLATVELWGTGNVYREFLYSEDLARAALFLMENYEGQETINVGPGTDVTIKEIAELIKQIVGYQGTLLFNPSMPDGTPKKLLDVGTINSLGWSSKTSLPEGLNSMLVWYRASLVNK